MTKKIPLHAMLRAEAGGKPKQLRAGGFIPAILYAPGIVNQSLKIKRQDFLKAFTQAGESALIDLTIDKEEALPVIIKDVQMDSTKGQPIHVDFYKVDMRKEITAEIPLVFIGDAPAVKELGGTLVKSKDTLEVECLPGDLPSEIQIDISVIKSFDDFIRIKDVHLADKIKIKGDPEEALVGAEAPHVEEAAPVVESEPTADQSQTTGAGSAEASPDKSAPASKASDTKK